MKKSLLFLTLLVMASLISFSNRCKYTCDGERKMIVAVEEEASGNDEAMENSPLLRIAVVL